MRISTHVVSDFMTNCYFLQDEGTGRTAIIDPGEFTDEMKEQIDRIGVEYFDYILLTHCHLDHMLGALEIHEYTGAPIAIYVADAPGLSDPSINGLDIFGAKAEKLPQANIILHDGESLKLGDLRIKVMHTAGHTIGSVCFIVDDVIFSGDTIFRESCGRVDLPTGNSVHLARSLEKIVSLEGDYKIYSGHGNPTTLSYERRNNPYLHYYLQ